MNMHRYELSWITVRFERKGRICHRLGKVHLTENIPALATVAGAVSRNAFLQVAMFLLPLDAHGEAQTVVIRGRCLAGKRNPMASGKRCDAGSMGLWRAGFRAIRPRRQLNDQGRSPIFWPISFPISALQRTCCEGD